MVKENIDIDYNLNAKQMMAALKGINTRLQETNILLENVNTKGAAGHTKQASSLKGLAMRFVGYNLVLGQVMNAQQKVAEYVKESITAFREFETRIAEVSTIMGQDFLDSIYGLQAGVESLSVSFGQNTSDMTKGLYDILSAAFDASEAIALLGTATKASIAGLAEVRESVSIFTTVLNTYGMSAYEATKVSDTLFQSVVRGKFQFRDLESALGYIVPIAAQAGIAFEELMAALSTATRHGLHLDMASRGLALAIQGIINPSIKAAKAAQKYQVQMDGLTLRVKGLTGFFAELNEKTKEYGSSVMGELIPNMRSLRVAMVLAGDEGIEGLIDDMDQLAISTGRTEEALEKIQNTSAFVAKQIDQEWEQTQRNVGKGWDEIALGAKGAMTSVVKDWMNFLPIIGPVFTAIDYGQKKELENWKASKKEQYRLIQGQTFHNEMMKRYLTLQEEIATKSKDIADLQSEGSDFSQEYAQLLALNDISTDLQDNFNRIFGEPIIGGAKAIEELEKTLIDIEVSISNLKDELETPIQVGWGDQVKAIAGSLRLTLEQKKAEQSRVDTQYDIKQALRDANYAWKTQNEDVQEAVSLMRDYEAAQKATKKATDELNRAMQLLNIQALEIQLKGMMRRRGLTRSEQKQLKRIQIEQSKLRLQGMKDEYDSVQEQGSIYEDKKQFIDTYVNKLQYEEYMLKYTLDAEISDLELHVSSEEALLKEREDQWRTTNQAIIDDSTSLVEKLQALSPEVAELLKEQGIMDVPEVIKQASGVKEEANQRKATSVVGSLAAGDMSSAIKTASPQMADILKRVGFSGFSRGTQSMPETMPIIAHRGEQIIPAGQNTSGGDTFQININVTGNNITKDTEDTLASRIAEQMQQGLMDAKGGTKYRMR